MLEFIYKHKILPLLILPLIAGAVALMLPSLNVFAVGESYTQSPDKTEIRAKGGVWDKMLKNAKEYAASGDALSLEINKTAEITSEELKGNFIILKLTKTNQFTSRTFILLDNTAPGLCSMAVNVNPSDTSKGKITAISVGGNAAKVNGWTDETCEERLIFYTAWDNDESIDIDYDITKESPVNIFQGDDVLNSLLGVIVFPCDPASDPATMKGAVLELCKKNRAAALENLMCDPSAQNKKGRCTPEVIKIVNCLNDRPTYSVSKCGNRAQKWADGDTSDVNGTMQPDDIDKICEDGGLSIQDVAKCKKNAREAKDKVLLVGCDADPTGPDCEGVSSCEIDGIGWLVCPALTFMGTLADGMYGAIAGMLTVDNDLVAVDGNMQGGVSATYSAWGTMRNVANVAFVIVFLIIIFSQLTNMVVSNYGVKKLLPRLIIAAILVNLSFTVCQLAVDLSNILGWSLRDVFTALTPKADISVSGGDASGNAGGWATIIALIIGGVGIAIVALSALIPILLSALVGLVIVFLILLLRKALIVILIILSPLAFVAFLLPNTEQWFKKWFKAFGAMLMVFPIVAVVFGASALAADIIKDAGDANANGDANIWMQLIAIGVAAAPLIIVPGILKKSIDGVGNIGAAINGLGSKMGSGLGNKYKNSDINKYSAARKADRKARISAGNYRGKGGKANPRNLRSSMNRKLNNNSAFNAVTSGFGAQRDLGLQAQDRKDRQDAIAMFGGDDDLVKAWAESGGDNKHGSFGALKAPQQAQFMRMRAAGHHRKASSHLAAVQSLSESGKGSASMVSSALSHARASGASETDTSGAAQQAIAAYRSSGRGDALADLSSISGTPMTQEQGWAQVSAESVHRDGIDPSNAAGAASFTSYLVSDPDNTRKALAGFDKMEGRAQGSAQARIIAAAQAHKPGSTITSIQEAKAAFGVV